MPPVRIFPVAFLCPNVAEEGDFISGSRQTPLFLLTNDANAAEGGPSGGREFLQQRGTAPPAPQERKLTSTEN